MTPAPSSVTADPEPRLLRELDRAALQRFFDRYFDRVYGYAYRAGRGQEFAEWVTDRVFREIRRSLPSLPADVELDRWVDAILVERMVETF